MTTRAQRLAAIEESLEAEPLAAKCLRLDKALFKAIIEIELAADRERILRGENRRLGERLSATRDELAQAHELIGALQGLLAEREKTA